MFPYDDTAGTVIRLAGDEANRLGTPGYDTGQVLLALLQTGDPVTRRVTEEDPRITEEAVRDRFGSAWPVPDGATSSPATAVAVPEFCEATTRFTATWRPLVRSRRLRSGPRLGTGQLWLAALEPGTGSARALLSLGSDPDAIRELVLATMVPESQPVPEWPTEVPPGAVQRLLGRLRGPGAQA